MKINKLLCGIIIAGTAMTFTGCGKKVVPSIYSQAPIETTCLGMSPTGVQTLKVWASGASVSKAVENAKKEAVRHVIFKNTYGAGACEQHALVTEANAEEKYEQYFTDFFEKKGDYRKFCKETGADKVKFGGEDRKAAAIVVDVNRKALKKKLMDDGIIKKQ